jgi:hypothetical protein
MDQPVWPRSTPRNPGLAIFFCDGYPLQRTYKLLLSNRLTTYAIDLKFCHKAVYNMEEDGNIGAVFVNHYGLHWHAQYRLSPGIVPLIWGKK